jgi:glycerophosphoryl diester phosphodiesterase
VLLLTFINASWLAPQPRGSVKLVAHRGIAQQFSRDDVDAQSCTATRIERPIHDYQENTIRSMQAAARLRADLIEIDIAPTADGRIAVFHDWTLDCRTDGTGEIRAKTVAELKALDIAHGYTADGGRTFPFRGSGRGAMPTLEQALVAVPSPILFNFKSNDPAEADQLAAALVAARRDVVRSRDAFYGGKRPVARIRQLYPDAWTWSLEEAKACTRDYLLYGWTTIVPASCREGTLVLPLDYRWAAWGWPNRLIERMRSVGARVVVTGDSGHKGLDLPEQLGDIPDSFNGYVWVEDMWTVGPALRPGRDFRTTVQQQAAAAALERRREKD